MSILFAATYPQRSAGLVLYGAMARTAWAPDNLWGRNEEQHNARLSLIEESWGQGGSADTYSPSLASNSEYRRWIGRLERASASPGAALALIRAKAATDSEAIRPPVPTEVGHPFRSNPATP